MDISGSPRDYPKLIAEKKHLQKVWGGHGPPGPPWLRHCDLPQCSNKFDFIMYADDTTLSSTIDSSSDINSNTNADTLINVEICKVIEWLKINKLSLNKNKSKYMTFHMPQNTKSCIKN